MIIRKQDLETLDPVMLAIMCKKISQDDSAEQAARERARQFKEDWIRLTEPERPPRNAKESEQVRRELAQLRAQMVDFLLPFVQAGFAS
jgi:hypothetical protein